MRLLLLAAILAISLTTATAQSANAWLINRRATATNYTSTATDWYIAATATLTNTLPLAASVRAGQAYVIKSTGAGNTVTIRPTGGNTIDGTAGDLTLTAQAEVTLISNGATNWEKTMAFQSSYGTTINPTDDFVPVRVNATTFTNSSLYRVALTNIATDGQVIFGPGNTNVLYRSGGDLVYTNAANNSAFKVLEGTGTGISLGNATTLNPTLATVGAVNGLFIDGGTNYIALLHDGAVQWYIGNNGGEDGILAAVDNSKDIGLAGNNRPRDIHIGRAAYVNAQTVHWGNQAYLAANGTTTSATLANISLSASVISGKKYSFTLVLFCANSVPADGVKIDFDGGSATATNFRAQAVGHDAALFLSQQVSALSTDIAAATVTGDAQIEVNGSFEPSGSGTLIPRFAVNSATTGTLTVYRGSNLVLTEIP